MRSPFLLVAALAVSSLAAAQNPVGQIYASDATVHGSVELAGGGTRVMSGSNVAAGDSTALMKLDRGGDVRICPNTNLSVATSATGRDLMFGISTGGMETHYTVSASADSIVTPDFRILLAGPGRFDFAIEADKLGNTCVRALPGNASSLIVSELMGDGTYQVKANEQVMFNNGKLAGASHEVVACGCPVSPPVMRAAATPPPSPPTEQRQPEPSARSHSPVHVEIDAPFVFRATDPEPSPLETAVRMRLANEKPFTITVPALAATPELKNSSLAESKLRPAPVKPQQKRFFGKIRSFFASIFR